MQENDPLAKAYNFDKIAIDAAREQSRGAVITALDAEFTRTDSRVINVNQDVLKIVNGVMLLGVGISPPLASVEISEPYDEFSGRSSISTQTSTDAEVWADEEVTEVFESRIVRIGMGTNPSVSKLNASPDARLRGFMGLVGMNLEEKVRTSDNIFLLAITAKDQNGISQENIKYGAVQTSDGVTEYFKYKPARELEDAERPHMLSVAYASGQMEDPSMQSMLVAVKLNPMEELMLRDEFEKATQVLKAKSDERAAAHANSLSPYRDHSFGIGPGAPSSLSDRRFQLGDTGQDPHC